MAGGPHREGEEPTPMMHGLAKSNLAIVAMKPANKAGAPAAEWMEPRAGTKGNAEPPRTRRTPSRGGVSQGLERVRQAEACRPCQVPISFGLGRSIPIPACFLHFRDMAATQRTATIRASLSRGRVRSQPDPCCRRPRRRQLQHPDRGPERPRATARRLAAGKAGPLRSRGDSRRPRRPWRACAARAGVRSRRFPFVHPSSIKHQARRIS